MDHRVAAVGVAQAQVNQPIDVSRVAPVLVEKLEKGELRDAARVLGGDFTAAGEPLDDLLGPDDPTNARTRRDDLGERLEPEDAAVDVDAQERWDEGLDEFLMGSRRRNGSSVRAGVGLHLEEVVRLVLDDVDIVLLRDLVHGFPSLRQLRRASGVLSGGDGVQHERLASAPRGFVPVAQDLVHVVRQETLLVHLDRHGPETQRLSGLHRAREAVLFHQDVVASLAQHAQGGIPCKRAPSSQTALPVGVWRIMDDLWPLAMLPTQLYRLTSVCSVTNRSSWGEPTACP